MECLPETATASSNKYPPPIEVAPIFPFESSICTLRAVWAHFHLSPKPFCIPASQSSISQPKCTAHMFFFLGCLSIMTLFLEGLLLSCVSPLMCHFQKFVFVLSSTYGLHMDFPPSLEMLCLTALCRDSPNLSLILHRYPRLLQNFPSTWDTTSESLILGFSTHRQEQCK